MTAILDAIDRLPTMVWALVVMLSAWAIIAFAFALMVGTYLAIGELVAA